MTPEENFKTACEKILDIEQEIAVGLYFIKKSSELKSAKEISSYQALCYLQRFTLDIIVIRLCTLFAKAVEKPEKGLDKREVCLLQLVELVKDNMRNKDANCLNDIEDRISTFKIEHKIDKLQQYIRNKYVAHKDFSLNVENNKGEKIKTVSPETIEEGLELSKWVRKKLLKLFLPEDPRNKAVITIIDNSHFESIHSLIALIKEHDH